MEDHSRRRSSAGSAASRRLRCLLALAGDYLKYLFMKRRRLMHRVARRTLALVHRYHGGRGKQGHYLMEHEFSCADSPSPAFLAAKRLLLRSRVRGGGAAAGAVSSCFGSLLRAPCGSPETAVDEEDRQLETEDDEEEDDDAVLAEDGWAQCGELPDVDDRAEEFINMFYEQLRAQSFAAVFQGSP
ncbi:uncharacterized protein LOC120656686 [Panicum virgatum]|uniref:Uncharacterized protein n=1 Tax=Panicum virgatum TaxID=38727 RepID=A0A8T0XTP6_PANVG|nr:uncharacterized protein LOC120656686 [Panicum virgatum]KAG2658759.1 hypothetical protein PVAP13_1KG307100 [Panicum virgatum]